MSNYYNESFTNCGNQDNFNFNSSQRIHKKLNAIIILIVIMMVGMFFSGCLYLKNKK
mgnify:CR=1 FL=1